jgi:hypothetical protein
MLDIITLIREMQIKATRYHYPPIRMAKVTKKKKKKRKKTMPSIGEDTEKMEIS